MNRRLILVLAVLFLSLFAVTAFAEEVLNIGYSGPITFARYGKNCLEGLQMYAEDINKAGGLKVGDKTYKLEIVALDDKYNPELSAKNALRLATKDKAPVIFCPHSGGIFAMMKFNQQNNFIVGAYSSDTYILPQIEKTQNRWIVRIPPDDRAYVMGFAEMAQSMGLKSMAMIPGTHGYAKDWADDLQAYWTYKGGKVVAREPANYYGKTDFYPYLTKSIEAKPDVMFLCGPSDVCANIVKQAHQLGYKGKFVMCDQAKLSEMEQAVGLEALEGSIGVIPLEQYKQMPWDRQAEWRKQYRERFNYVPTWEANLHYEALSMFCKAMQLAQTVDKLDVIMAALPNVYPAASPDASDVYGVVRQCMALSGWGMSVQNGKYTKPVWAGPSVLPYGYFEIPGAPARKE